MSSNGQLPCPPEIQTQNIDQVNWAEACNSIILLKFHIDSISTHPLNVARLEARLAMEKNPDDHPCESAAILHELLNEMENLRVE
ncbi:hypothetical protein Tco_1434993 [Tanacetum coccineum]